MGDSDDIVTLGIGGLLGYGIAISKYTEWEPLIKNFKDRLNHLSYLKIVIPYKFFQINENCKQIYVEGLNAYLYGLPNASLPLILRCLEVGLKNKYSETKELKNFNLNNLINLAEGRLKDKKEIAHGFRILRNLIHSEKLVTEQDVLEAIRHISNILNLIYKLPEYTELEVFCKNCNTKHHYRIETSQYYIGNNMLFGCDKFKQNISITIMP
jgi:RNase P subunit RPR2